MSFRNGDFSPSSHCPEMAGDKIATKTRVVIPNYRFHPVLKPQVPAESPKACKEQLSSRSHKRSPAAINAPTCSPSRYSATSSITLMDENSRLRLTSHNTSKLGDTSWKPLKLPRREILRDLDLNSPRVAIALPSPASPLVATHATSPRGRTKSSKSNSLSSIGSLSLEPTRKVSIRQKLGIDHQRNTLHDLAFVDHSKRHGVYDFPPLENLPQSESGSSSASKSSEDFVNAVEEPSSDISMPDFEAQRNDFACSTPIHSQPSLPSIYSQDDHLRPPGGPGGISNRRPTSIARRSLQFYQATTLDLPPLESGEMKHHEIIQKLLDEVEQLLLQWASLYNQN